MMGNPYFNPFGFTARKNQPGWPASSAVEKPLVQDLRAILSLLNQQARAFARWAPETYLYNQPGIGIRWRYGPAYGTGEALPNPGSCTLELQPIRTVPEPHCEEPCMESEVYQCARDLGIDPWQVSFDDWQEILQASANMESGSGQPEIAGIFDLDMVREELRLRYGGGLWVTETMRSTEAVGIGNKGGGHEAAPAMAA